MSTERKAKRECDCCGEKRDDVVVCAGGGRICGECRTERK